MGDALDVAEAQCQKRLRTFERLGLALLIHTQDHRVLRRIQVEPGYVDHLLDEEGIGGDLEMLLAMGLNAKGTPHAVDGGLGQVGLLGRHANTPMGGLTGRILVQGRMEQLHDLLILDRTGPPGAVLIIEAHESLRSEALAPAADRLTCDSHLLCHAAVIESSLTEEDDLG